MFKFEDYEWYANRGTGGVITLKPKEGLFDLDDDVKINVYGKNRLNEKPVLTKSAIISEDGTKATIELTNNDMEIGEVANKKTEYWYEIKINGSTVVGWDEDGAKKLMLFPEGSED